ncbi:MAG: tetratricopeptide repeat protein [Nitrosomonas sp.]|nr:tetratricopeptide repeat protein [Nitrosomonas sp.]
MVKAVPQDYKQAVDWYRKAAAQGDAGAQYNLGVMYFEGKGVPQDYKQAVDCYKKAAAQGNATAQNNLGRMYANGQGVSQDYVRAHMWLNLAAAQGDSVAVKNRDLAAKIMTAAQIAEAQKMARECEQRNYKGCN